MERAIPLGHLAGIRLGMSWTVPFVAVLYAVALTNGQLPAAAPGEPGSTYWIVGMAGAALFFLSLLAHEMGHALVGRHEGIGVRGITLTLLGGYTELETEPATPGAELRVSGVGPVATAICALLFFGGAQAVAGQPGFLAVVGEMFAWLAVINLLLAVLNLLPGAPLDGGAVLGALIWMATGDRTRSQSITAVIGMILGGGIALWGVLLLRGGSDLGIWSLLIGGFIAANAVSRLRSAPTMGALRTTRLGEVMLPDPPLVPEGSTLADVAARANAWQPHTAFPVQSADGRITGLLTAEVIMAVDPHRWNEVRARDVAWPLDRVSVASTDDPVLDAVRRCEASDLDRILVVWPDGRVAGTSGRDAATRALAAAGPRG